MAKKTKTLRSETKNPNLKVSVNLKKRYEEIEDLASYAERNDIDTLRLSETDKAWLDKFAKEYVGASLDTKNPENNLHKTPEQIKSCYDRNNARNRCMYTEAKVTKKLIAIEEWEKKADSDEESVPELVDLKKTNKKTRDSK